MKRGERFNCGEIIFFDESYGTISRNFSKLLDLCYDGIIIQLYCFYIGEYHMSAKNVPVPLPAYRIFISSTYVDMLPYREAMQAAITNCDAVAYGMERFVPAPIRPLDRCYEEIAGSQIYVLLLGHRYGEIDKDSGKSFTELEYDRAKEIGLPILAFLLDTDKVGALERFRESDAQYEALLRFKNELKNSKEITIGVFTSEKDLQDKATRAIKETMNRLQSVIQTAEDPSIGAKQYAKFIKRPERYKGNEAVLRVRMDGRFGDARLREELYEAFNMPIGDALYLNDLFVLGSAIDVDQAGWLIDAWANGEAADWLDDNEVTTGTTFEAKFRFAYEIVKNGGRIPGGVPHDVYHAKLIMIKGIRVVEKEPKKPTSRDNSLDNKINVFPEQVTNRQENGGLPAGMREALQTMLERFQNVE